MAAIQRLQHVSVPMPSDGMNEARQFYGKVLGLTPIAPPSSLAPGSVSWFRIADTDTEVHVFIEEPFRGGSTGQHLCLQVDDIAAYRDRLSEHGVEIEETIAIRNRPRFFVHDPFGNRVEITQIQGPFS
jgi:catechol 2,3-dioxygenase-like lactoylglutathione lyase family enzyme